MASLGSVLRLWQNRLATVGVSWKSEARGFNPFLHRLTTGAPHAGDGRGATLQSPEIAAFQIAVTLATSGAS